MPLWHNTPCLCVFLIHSLSPSVSSAMYIWSEQQSRPKDYDNDNYLHEYRSVLHFFFRESSMKVGTDSKLNRA